YNAVPPPHTKRFSPPRIEFSHTGLPEFAEPGVEGYGVKPIKVVTQTSSVKISKPIKENNSAPLIEDWESKREDEVESPPKIERKTVEPSMDKVEVDIPKQNDKPARRPVKYAEMYKTQRPRGNQRNWNNLKSHQLGSSFVMYNKACYACRSFNHLQARCKYHRWERMGHSHKQLEDQGYFDSGCSRHMIGNIFYLTDFKEFNRGYAAFGAGAKGATKDETSRILKSFITKIENLVDKKVKIIKCDNGTKFKNRVMNEFCDEKGIKREYSVAKTPQQNRVAEKSNKTLIKAAGTMVLVVKPHIKIPYELFRDEGFFIGYSINSKAFRVYNTRTRNVEENLHVNFVENKPIIAGDGPKWLFDIDALMKLMNYVPVMAGTNSNDFAGKRSKFDAGQSSMETGPSQDYILMPLWNNGSLFDSSSKNSDGENKDNDGPCKESENDNQERPNAENSTKDVNIVGPSINTASSNVNTVRQSDDFFGADNDMRSLDGVEVDIRNIFTTYPILTTLNTRIHKDHSLDNVIGDMQSEPKRILNAIKDPAWVEAIQEELLQFPLQKVWTLVDLPRGKRAIGAKWVFRNMKDKRGIVIRNKAKLVAQGFTQEEGIDYDEVFAPVARINAIRLYLAYASFMEFLVYQMDIKSAFLYRRIKEEVYVCQPLGFEDLNYPDKVYKVEKALYGLHQAPRAWYETLAKYLLDNGFHRGLQVKQKSDGIFISQDKYVNEILRKFKYADVKPANTSIDKERALFKDLDGEGIFVGNSTTSKAFRVYNIRTRKVEENLHITFLENKPMIACGGPEWLFDIDALSKSINYTPVPAVNTATPTYADYPNDPLMPDLEDAGIFDDAYDDRDEGTEVDYNNLETIISFSPIPTTRIYKDHPKEQIIREGYRQEEDIDYDEVSAPVARIEAIRLFLAYALFMDFTVYQIDVKSAFLYGTIKEEGEGPTSPVRTQHTPTVIKTSSQLQNTSNTYRKTRTSTRRMGNKIPQSNVSSSVADEAITKEMHDRLGRVTTTASSLEAKQGRAVVTYLRSKPSLVQARSERLSNLPNELPLEEGNTSRSREGSMQLLELMDICTKLSDKVIALENELKSTKAVYNKALITLTKRVKELEKNLKHKRNRAVVDSSEDEEANNDDITLAETLVNIKKSAPKDKGKAIMQESEPPNKIKKKEMIQISLDDEIAQRKTRTNIRRMGNKIPQSNVSSSVADEAITKEMHDRLGRVTTTASSLEAEQGRAVVTYLRSKPSLVQARSERLSNLPNELPLKEGNTSRSREGSMQLLELIDICTKLSDKVIALENELKSTKTVYNKALITLTKRVKELEKNLKHKRKRTVVDSSEDEEASLDKEDSPKQGRMIEKVDEDENVNLVKSSKQGEAHETAGHKIKSDDTEVMDFSTASPQKDDDITLAETLVNIKKSAPKDKGKAIMQESEPPNKIKKKEMIQISLDDEIT
nr:hypothetical protein [Tanacetum cinerariifolium]